MGSLATFIGANVYAPRKPWMPTTYKIVLQGWARTEKEAEARVAAFVKARLAERVGKALRRARGKGRPAPAG
jgi:hypothetical protein